jgi:hypothetical protein
MPRGRPPICPNCGSNRSQKKGVRKTKTMGARRIRLCKSCGKKFTPKNQKLVQVENEQSESSQSQPVDPIQPEDPSIDETRESLPDDPNGLELNESAELTDGY